VSFKYSLVVKKTIELLNVLIEEFCGDAHISFEGDLSTCDLGEIRDVSFEPTAILPRNTIWPQQDYVIVSLEVNTKDILAKRTFPKIGLRKKVLHVMIEKEGKLVFGAYDNFHLDCVGISDVDEVLLESLIEKKIIRQYELIQGNQEESLDR
jgi:hypothetical protein